MSNHDMTTDRHFAANADRSADLDERDARLAASPYPPRSWDRYHEAVSTHRDYRTKTPMPNMACQDDDR